jgi:hypothetical protein
MNRLPRSPACPAAANALARSPRAKSCAIWVLPAQAVEGGFARAAGTTVPSRPRMVAAATAM